MIKDELKEFVFYNEIISNLAISALVFLVITFGLCISGGTLSPRLFVPMYFAGSIFIGLSIFDYIKR